MGKVTKKAVEKHKVSLSPALQTFIEQTLAKPLYELPAHLATLSTRWPFPRGDLYNWIGVLDRFDALLQSFNERYGLHQGPQTRPFGTLLLRDDSSTVSEETLTKHGFGLEADRELVESVLSFSRLLLEKCGNRALYNSTDRLNELLNTTSLSLLYSTLRVTLFLAQRFAERSNTPQLPRPQFYNFDHDKLNKLAAPVVSQASASPYSGKRGTVAMGREGTSRDTPPTDKPRRTSSVLEPDEFRSLIKPEVQNGVSDQSQSRQATQEWRSWATVRVTWSLHQSVREGQAATLSPTTDDNEPPTPTPNRRQPSSLSRSPMTSAIPAQGTAPAERPTATDSSTRSVGYTAAELEQTTAHDILAHVPEDMPPKVRYELLQQLRVSYGLLHAATSRTCLLEIRLLSIAILAYIYDEHEFPRKLFGSDFNPSARQKLVQQIVSLLQHSNKAHHDMPLSLQTLAIECLVILGRQRMFANDTSSALSPSSSHGLLLLLTQRALADIAQDDDATDNAAGDDWREAIFSLLSTVMSHGLLNARTSETVIHPSLVQAYARGLRIMTDKALRIHLRILDFMKNFYHHFKDGLQVLSANGAFEAACEQVESLSKAALVLLRQGKGIPTVVKTKVTDYQIPYLHQQVIRSMIDLVNDVIGNQGGHAERVLRNLVDSQSLLDAFQIILSNIDAFGAHTWSEVVKAIVSFLHNEPTSYTIISDAGIIQTLLDMVAADPGRALPGNGTTIVPIASTSPLKLPANTDAIVNISQAFGAICLTNAGLEHFKSTGTLETFFEIFHSAPHLKVIQDANTLTLLGSTFDELARHHPQLRDLVMSLVVVTIARVRNLCSTVSQAVDANPRLRLDPSLEMPSANANENFMAAAGLLIPTTEREGKPDLIALPNGDFLDGNVMTDTTPTRHGLGTSTDRDVQDLTMIDYARPAISFLMNFFENQSLCSSFMETGAGDIVLDFVTLPSVPVDEEAFNNANAYASELASLVHMMAETKPQLVLPVLVDRAQYLCSTGLDDFIKSQPPTLDCYFDIFVRKRPKDDAMDLDDGKVVAPPSKGTTVVKHLASTLLMAQVLAESFNLPLFAARNSHNNLFGMVNIADLLADLCRLLGSLSAACYREEIALQKTIPDAWHAPTRPGNFSTGDRNVDKILSVLETGAQTAADSNSSSTPDQVQEQQQQDDLQKDKESVEYKNVQLLRYLLIETPSAITELFQRVGRGIAFKRRSADTFAKQKTYRVAEALARAYITQLEPYFLPVQVPTDDEEKRSRFNYLVLALSNVGSGLYDDSPTLGPSSSRQSFVVDVFRQLDGMKVLSRIGTEFFDELKSCKVAKSMFSANTGLKICLDIFDDLTTARNITDSNQSACLKNTDAARPFYFNPSQLLMELRMEALPLTRLIWNSDYADQASQDVVQKLIAILKHVFNGDHESDAVQTPAARPKLTAHTRRKYQLSRSRMASLREKGFPEDLIREALYRCNLTSSTSSVTGAEEYCKAFLGSNRRRKLPIPAGEADEGTPGAATARTPPAAQPIAASLFGNAALAEVVNNITGAEMDLDDIVAGTHDSDQDEESDDGAEDEPDDDDDDHHDHDDDDHSDTHGGGEHDNNATGEHDSQRSSDVHHTTTVRPADASTASAPHMGMDQVRNAPETNPAADEASSTPSLPLQPSHPSFSVQDIDAARDLIREHLSERCNNILNNHQNLTFEISELILSATKKMSNEAKKGFWESTSSLLVSSLSSMQADGEEMTEARGARIAAAAHLIALLIQDNEVFYAAKKIFQDAFDSLLSFLQLQPVVPAKPDAPSYPWVALILLIIERMLSLDAEPAEVKWTGPTSNQDSCDEPEIIHHPVFTMTQRKELLGKLIGILPHVGKDKSMGLSVVRLLVILTRHRDLALIQGQKGNLQKLFLMIKQLGSGATGRLQNSFMIILRHIIEDAETVKRIMRSEIIANFKNRTSSRQLDLATFVRDNSHLVLRNPDLFVEVANELVQFTGSSHSSNSPLGLRDVSPASADTQQQPKASVDPENSLHPTASIEKQDEPGKGKAPEIKPPVVEHPDGVIHFLLSELLAYKDVEDKESVNPPAKTEGAASPAPEGATVSTQNEMTVDQTDSPDKGDIHKPHFKADDNPIFIYRCFLLHCVTELLYSYNRCKIEFINFSRKSDPQAMTPSKPRSGVLNYILNGLVCSNYVEKDETLNCKKKITTSSWARRAMVALCTKTGENSLSGPSPRYSTHPQVDDQDDEPDLTFVRRFVLEHAIRAFKDASASGEPLQIKYGRLLCLGDLFHKLLLKPSGPDGAAGNHNTSYKVLGRMMFEKNLISVLTASLTEIDLTFPSARKVIKFVLRPLQELTTLAVHLSLNSSDPITSAIDATHDDTISSASSVSELDELREETPDLFRNSALGMLDPRRQADSDTSEDIEDEEMYDDEYDDEMDYEGALEAPHDGEVISDEELDAIERGPIEGIPGDRPMDIEFVMGTDDHSHSESGEDEESSSDGDEANDDFEIGLDEDEINADAENDSLGDGEGNEDDWEDEPDAAHGDDDDEVGGDEALEDGEDVTFDGEDLPMPAELGLGGHGDHAELNNLLRALGEHDLDLHAPPPVRSHLIVENDRHSQQEDDEDDEDDGDEGDELDEDEAADYVDGFNMVLDGHDGFDGDDRWALDEMPPPFFRRHRHASRHLPSFIGRRAHPMDGDILHSSMGGGRHHRHVPHARPGVDDGTNPLLQRSDSNRDRNNSLNSPFNVVSMSDRPLPGIAPGMMRGNNMVSMQIPIGGDLAFDGFGSHGAVLDALVQALNQGGDNRLFASGGPGQAPLQVNVNIPVHLRDMFAHGVPRYRSRSVREEPARAATFIAMTTMSRWQEEVRILFGNTYIDKVQRVQLLLLSKLVPLAQEEEKVRRRKRKEEEERAKKEAEEAEKRRSEQERLEKEDNERKAAEQAEAEAKLRAEAEAEAAATGATGSEVAQSSSQPHGEPGEPMEGVQDQDLGEGSNLAARNIEEPPPARVVTTIRGRELDITGLDIDLEYLEALPEELREEVIMAQYAERRDQQQQRGTEETSTIDPDFLDALPEDIREEIRQQEAHMARHRERENRRREEAANIGSNAQAEEMDNDNFLATLDPVLRRAILAEQPPEILSQLDPRHAAEGRAQQRGLYFHHRFGDHGTQRERARQDHGQKEKRQVVQLVDKAGVATLLRLMFVPHQGSLRQNLLQVLSNICGNRQTRLEVISLLLNILKEGSVDVTAVEKSLANLSLRAKASAPTKTPQSAKRNPGVQQTASSLSEEMTPLIVVQQCLSAMSALCRVGFHVKTIFLREVDVHPTKSSKKGKNKESRVAKYPLNDLIVLFDRRLIMDSSSCLQALSELLAQVTGPLVVLMKKDEKSSGSKDKPEPTDPEIQPASDVISSEDTAGQVPVTSSSDTAMTEAPGLHAEHAQPSTGIVTTHEAGTSATVSGTQDEVIPPSEAKEAGDEEGTKKKPAFEPPVVSDHNLKLITNVFVAPECHNETFHAILDTLRNLANIPGTSAVFSTELINHVQTLSQSIGTDLDGLLPLIREAQSTSDLQGITFSKFSAASSDQVKLLRVLQALDWLSAPKKDINDDSETVKSILTSSYDSLALGPLWHKLSACLTAVREKGDAVGFTNILLPLIESLMVVCKNTPLKDAPVAAHTQDNAPLMSPRPEGMNDLEELFFNFTTEHRKILNDIVRQSPKLMQGNGNFSLLVKNSKVLDFDNKRNYFAKTIHSRQNTQRHIQPPLQLSVRRDNVFLDSYKNLYFKSADEMKYGKLNIRFAGEEGVDAGGVTREWFQVLARGMFDANYALFQPVASDRTTFHPSPLSAINPEHLVYFKFIGRIIGKALHEGRVLDCHFSRAVYKGILGKSPNLKDLESQDVDYYKSLTWILENDITDILTEEFCVVEDDFGAEKIIDLIPDGRNISVTEDNKKEYVQKLVEYRLTESVRDQLDHFLQGFHDIIPADLVAIFNEQELELLISGLPEIDVDDWKANTEYHNYSPSSTQVVWFWRIVRGMTNEERAKLLQFITGTSKVPLNGFKELEGVSGLTKFNIHKDPSTTRLPTSHTCFNQLDLPAYDSLELMKHNLNTAINLGADYFGFA